MESALYSQRYPGTWEICETDQDEKTTDKKEKAEVYEARKNTFKASWQIEDFQCKQKLLSY